MKAPRQYVDLTETVRDSQTERQHIHSNEQQETTSSSTTTYHTEPGVLCTPMELEQIRTLYEDVIGRLNVVKAQDIEEALKAGVKAEAVLDALEQTALAPRPSHYYLRAILRRYTEKGIHTVWDAERERHIRRSLQTYAREERDAWYKPADYDQYA